MTTASLQLPRPAAIGGRTVVVLIGVFKLFKAALLILLAVGALELMNPRFGQMARDWANDLVDGPDRSVIGDWVANKVLGLNVKFLVEIAVGATIYATVFTIEGLGLLFDKLWAEWMAVVSTSLLIPLEVHETVVHHSLGGAVTFVFNVAIVIYLIHRVKARMAAHGKHAAAASPAAALGAPASRSSSASPASSSAPPAKVA